MNVRLKLIAGAVVLVALAGTYGLLHESGALATILDIDALQAQVGRSGHWGPVLIVALMMLAILVSPIPSAPIALAAGAAYGPVFGALYVLLGAGGGAMLAFGVARFVGHEALHRWFGPRLSVGLVGSQNMLMGIVFVSRLLPFLSFDIVSYAAGLTVLRFWRFSLATLAGIAPTSYLLARVGSEMATGEADRMLFAALVLGGVTLIPLAVKVVRDWRSGRRDGGAGGSG